MTKQAGFKRRVRARMAKTGESYATARSRLLAGQAGTTPDDSPRFLGEAFDRLSLEYPAMRDGLSLTERRVLAAVADGAPDAGTAFVRAGSRETRPYMGDTACFGRMDRMAQGAAPAAPPRPDQPPRGTDDWDDGTETIVHLPDPTPWGPASRGSLVVTAAGPRREPCPLSSH